MNLTTPLTHGIIYLFPALSALATLIVLSAVFLSAFEEVGRDRRARRGPNPFGVPPSLSSLPSVEEPFLDTAKKKMRAIMKDAPRDKSGLIKLSPFPPLPPVRE